MSDGEPGISSFQVLTSEMFLQHDKIQFLSCQNVQNINANKARLVWEINLL